MVAPALFPLLVLVVGMLAGWHLPGWRDGFLFALVGSAACALFTFLSFPRRPWLQYAPLLIPLLLLGAVRTSLRLNPRLPPHHVARLAPAASVFLEGVLRDSPDVYRTHTRLSMECSSIVEEGSGRPCTGRVDLFLHGTSQRFEAGDILLAKVRLKVPRDLGNPLERQDKARSFLLGVYVRGDVQDPYEIVSLGTADGYSVWRWIARVRKGLERFLEQRAEPETCALMKALLLGDRVALPEGVEEDFRKTGLSHLFALSGLNVSMVFLFFHFLWSCLLKRSVSLLRMGVVKKTAILASLPFVLFYVALAGNPITAVRAALMTAISAGALCLNRTHAMWNGLCVAALLLLMADPGALFSISFLLSFVATAFLLAGVKGAPSPHPKDRPGLAKILGRKISEGMRGVFRVTVLASLAVAPLTAYFFHGVTPFAVLSNLVVVPVVCWVVLPLGMILSLFALTGIPGEAVFLWPAKYGTAFVLHATNLLARIPGSWIRTGAPTVLEMAACYAALVLLLLPRRNAVVKRLVALCTVCFLLSIGVSVLRSKWDRHLAVTFLSVGNGDSILVEFPGGRRLLLDGGPARKGFFDAGQRIVAPFLGNRRLRRLDFVVASHGQSDHYGGLQRIVDQFHPAELWVPPRRRGEEEGYEDFLAACAGAGVVQRRLCRGTPLPTFEGADIEVLNPPCDDEQISTVANKRYSGSVNSGSLVLRLKYGSVSFLLTGDIERDAESDLLRLGSGIRACILKVPHHGSAGSSSGSFLDRVAPMVAVISCGSANRFGFPSRGVRERYRERGISLYRTSRDGAVHVRTDGHEVVITSGRGREERFTVDAHAPQP